MKTHGPSRNPWHKDFSTGGSSGGSAAAVAARIVPIAGASDRRGSIRLPASACGLVGLKPSRGRVPVCPDADRAHGSSVLGCVSRTVRDTAAYLDAVSGWCDGDPYTPPTPNASFLQLSSQDPRRLHIGFTTSLPFGYKLDGEVATSVADTARMLERMGHDVQPYDLTFDIEACCRANLRIIAVQAALQFQKAEAEFGVTLGGNDEEPWIRTCMQKTKSIDAVMHAMDIDLIRPAGRDIASKLARFDAFLCPVYPQRLFRIGEWGPLYDAESDSGKIALLAFLFPVNVSGLLAISLPVHESQDGLPMGVQLVGRYGDEATLLSVANVLERQVRWDERLPPILTTQVQVHRQHRSPGLGSRDR
ncbi:amidase [Bradyrhizobium sp. 25ACV]